VLRKQLLEQKSTMGVSDPTRTIRLADASPWYYRTIPLKVGIPASIALLAILYVAANGVPSLRFGGAAHQIPKSLPHSSPHNND